MRAALRVVYGFLKKHHLVINLVVSIFVGVTALFVSCRVADIADDQRRIQELSVLPQIAFQCRPSEESSPSDATVDLVITNLGGVINRLTVGYWTILPLRISAPRSPDTTLAFVHLTEFFYPPTITYRPQGEIARLASTFSNNGYSRVHAAAVYESTDVVVLPGRPHHLFHLTYSDALDQRWDRFVIVDDQDFRSIPADVGKQLVDSLTARSNCQVSMTNEYPERFRTTARTVLGRAGMDRTLLSKAQITR